MYGRLYYVASVVVFGCRKMQNMVDAPDIPPSGTSETDEGARHACYVVVIKSSLLSPVSACKYLYLGLWARQYGSGGREEEYCRVLYCRPYMSAVDDLRSANQYEIRVDLVVSR